MFQSEIGSEVAIRFGGDFVYDPKPDDPARDVLLLGGGVGINPLYCIMNYIADLNKFKTLKQFREGKKPNTLLLYSSSKTEELLFKVKYLLFITLFILYQIEAKNNSVNPVGTTIPFMGHLRKLLLLYFGYIECK